MHWYDNFFWLCFDRLEQITCSASQCRGVRPHRGDAAYARHKSHGVCPQLLPVTAARCSELSVQRGRLVVHCCSAQISSMFPRLLLVTSVCCLELSLQNTPLIAHLVLPILHDLNFCSPPVLGGGSARSFDRRLCIRRQALQASVLVLETVRTNGHRAGLSHSCPFTFQPSTWSSVRALSCVPWPDAIVCLLRHCCCEHATHVAMHIMNHCSWHCSCFLSRRDQGVKRIGVERYLGLLINLGSANLYSVRAALASDNFKVQPSSLVECHDDID